MAKKYLRICNRNTTSQGGLVAREYMLILGASTQRGLTNQGVGTKMAGIQAMMKGIEFYRASRDGQGEYLAWYEKEPYSLGYRGVLCIRRPDSDEVERTPMTVDVHLFDDGWAEHSMGNNWPIIREPILDAADEDANFTMKVVDRVEFAPPGYTCTYVEIPDESDAHLGYNTIRHVVEMPEYYFHRTDDVVWLTKYVGYAKNSVTASETRLFITAEGAPVAYVAWSSGDKTPEAAFDYILRETPQKKFASMPKRIVEDSDAARRLVAQAIPRIEDPADLAIVFSFIAGNGYESRMYLEPHEYVWRDWGKVRKAAKIAWGNAVPHMAKDSLWAAALTRNIKVVIVPEDLYKVLYNAGVKTLTAMLGRREKGKSEVRAMTQDEKMRLASARQKLSKHMPWVSTKGHVFMALDSDYDGGRHMSRHEGFDVIAINFNHSDRVVDPERYLIETILHELVHHDRGENSTETGYHDEYFSESLLELLMPPFID